MCRSTPLCRIGPTFEDKAPPSPPSRKVSLSAGENGGFPGQNSSLATLFWLRPPRNWRYSPCINILDDYRPSL